MTVIQFCEDFIDYGDGQPAIAMPVHVLHIWCHAPTQGKPAIVPAGEMESALKKVCTELACSMASLQE